jgi:hypothetical protein
MKSHTLVIDERLEESASILCFSTIHEKVNVTGDVSKSEFSSRCVDDVNETEKCFFLMPKQTKNQPKV